MATKLATIACLAVSAVVGCTVQEGAEEVPGGAGTGVVGDSVLSASSGVAGTSTNGGGPGASGTTGLGGNTAAGASGPGSSGAPTAAAGVNATGGQAATGGAAGTASTGVGGGTPSGATGGSSGAAGNGGAEPMGGAGAGGAAGASSGAGGGGGGSDDGYHPCPSSPCKIMPLGDSISFGVGDEANGGYRGPLFAAAVADGKQITFTGSLSNGPSNVSGQPFPKQNEGHSGWGISEVTPYSNGNAGIITVIPDPGFSSSSGGVPDIVLLHIGTNDSGNIPASRMTTDLADLLDQVIANAPEAYVVVAQIIPLGYGTNDEIKAYNASIPDLVQGLADEGKHVTLVDMFSDFDAGAMIGSDSVHPNAAGYEFMANHWYSVIGPLLPQ